MKSTEIEVEGRYVVGSDGSVVVRRARRTNGPRWDCRDCGSEITGPVFLTYSGTMRERLCYGREGVHEACWRPREAGLNRTGWDESVRQGTPGKYLFFGYEGSAVNPDEFQPDLRTRPCEICQREIDYLRSLTDRRTVEWCGHVDCYPEALRLSKRVVPTEARPCERCGEMHARKRGARYCSDLCRALASRERSVAESGSDTTRAPNPSR